jgi:hypothetical protein
MERGAKTDKYFMDQSEAIAIYRFLEAHDMTLCDDKCREGPMPEAEELYSGSELLSEDESSWCRSVIGCLHFLVRASRWDVELIQPLESH